MPPAPTSKETTDRHLVQAVREGDFRAIARMISLVERESPGAVPCLQELFPHTGKCLTIGITGSPGVGKSTLVDRLAAHYRSLEQRVGIIAVDPSSPFSGGAILGDRIRMQSRSLDAKTFIRSMATRGNLGGLARTTSDALLVMDAAGFDTVLVETVGVGQDEVEIAKTAHITLVLLVPGMGDDVQSMKAGIMEIADIFVINKADHPGAGRMEAELAALLSLNDKVDDWRPPVIRTVASAGTGIEECAGAIEDFRLWQRSSVRRQDRLIEIHSARLVELARSLVLRRLLAGEGSAGRLEALAKQVAKRELDPYSAAELLLENWGDEATGNNEE